MYADVSGGRSMKQVDIMEMIVNAIEKKIFNEWKHEGFIGGFTSAEINFEVDGQEYELVIHEVLSDATGCNHYWECIGMSTVGTQFRCKYCGETKTEPFKTNGDVEITTV